MPAIAEPTVTTSNEAPKSFLNSPEFGDEIQKALEADAASRTAKAEPKAEPKPAPVVMPAAEAKAAVAVPARGEHEIPEDIKSPAAQSSWKKLKDAKAEVEKERDEWKTKHDAVSTRIADLEKAAKTPAQQAKLEDSAEYQQLKALAEAREKQLEEYSERIRLIDVEQHPRFQEYFKNKTDAQFEIAKEIGGDKLVDALRLPPGEYRKQQLNEIASELDTIAQSQLGSVLTRLREIESERSGEIAKAKSNYQQIQAQQKEQSEKQRAAVESVFKQVSAEVTNKETGLSVFQERAGDAEWNQKVSERLALAQHAFAGKLKPEDTARLAHWGAAAPVLLTELNGAQAKIADLEKQITELRGVIPNPGGTKPGENDTQTQSTKKGLDGLMESITAAMPTARS